MPIGSVNGPWDAVEIDMSTFDNLYRVRLEKRMTPSEFIAWHQSASVDAAYPPPPPPPPAPNYDKQIKELQDGLDECLTILRLLAAEAGL
jgi:hypothetical protein